MKPKPDGVDARVHARREPRKFLSEPGGLGTHRKKMKPKPGRARRKTGKRTELRRASAQAARRLAKDAAEREWRVFLTESRPVHGFAGGGTLMLRYNFLDPGAWFPSSRRELGSSEQISISGASRMASTSVSRAVPIFTILSCLAWQ